MPAEIPGIPEKIITGSEKLNGTSVFYLLPKIRFYIYPSLISAIHTIRIGHSHTGYNTHKRNLADWNRVGAAQRIFQTFRGKGYGVARTLFIPCGKGCKGNVSPFNKYSFFCFRRASYKTDDRFRRIRHTM